jgi:hypothetical protein
MPGPRIDLDVEMVAWWDRWLRGRAEEPHRDRVDLFLRSSTVPEPDLDLHRGRWISDTWPSAHTTWEDRPLPGPRSLRVVPDTGVPAWIDCAGHLPWGLSGDQAVDDARSMCWEWPADSVTIVGQPRVRLRLTSSQPVASLSVKLCDVFADGTSALVARGTVDLTFRDGVHGRPAPLEPGTEHDVVVELDACAYEFAPGQVMRLAVAGADWPNTVAPPAPVELTVLGGALELPLWGGPGLPPPVFVPGAETSGEESAGVEWTVSDDVLRRTTSCAVRHGSSYAVPHEGRASEEYAGSVVVDRRTFRQAAEASCTFRLRWPGVDVDVTSTMRVDVDASGYDVAIDAEAHERGELVGRRTWTEHIDR